MKGLTKGSGNLMAASAVLVLSLFLSKAEESHFYLKGDLGGSWIGDVTGTVKGAGVLQEEFGSGVPVRARFHPGVRVGMTCGYEFTDWFAAEAELGGVLNEVEQGSLVSGSRAALGPDTRIANVPLLFNARFQYPNSSHWRPYIGAGLGVSASIMDGVLFARSANFNAYYRQEIRDADAVLAYHAFAGLRYRLNDRMGLQVEYRYLVTESPEWGDFLAIGFRRIETHAFSLAFDYHF